MAETCLCIFTDTVLSCDVMKARNKFKLTLPSQHMSFGVFANALLPTSPMKLQIMTNQVMANTKLAQKTFLDEMIKAILSCLDKHQIEIWEDES